MKMNNQLIIKKSTAIMLALMMLFSIVGPTTAQGDSVAPGMNVPAAPSQRQGPTDPAELESFLDGLLAQEMQEDHIAGAAVAVVKDGQLFFAKGYGYADVENKISIDPEQTIFRIGSLSKLFTSTAVMQLVEQGKLDLDADVNTYLDFRIPDTYSQPVTLKHLMTHTSGFEDRAFEVLVSDAADLVPVREWLVSHMSARVSPPGEYAAYSNFNTMLAGYIVERVSGQPYDQYIKEHILNPLGMVHSNAHAPMPLDLRPYESKGYTYDDGFQVYPYYLGQLAIVPAGGLQASATDMARFMIAHLQNGLYSDTVIAEARILKETPARQMHSPLYTADPRLLGTAYGFFDFTDNGQWTIGHDGAAPPTNSILLLLPDRNLGVFVVYNSQVGDLTSQHLGFQRAFFDHYYPAPAVEPIQRPADFAERARQFEGSYKLTRGSQTTLEKVVGLFGAAVEIKDPGNGTLLMSTPWGDWQFVEVEPNYFRQVDGRIHILFRTDERGQIRYLFTDLTPMFAFEKLEWYEMPGFNIVLLLVSQLIFLSNLIVALVRAIRNRRTNDSQSRMSRGARVAQWIIVGISILNLLFVVGTVLWGNPAPLFGVAMIYKIVLGLGVVSAVLTVGALVYTVLAWKKSYWGVASRLYYTLVTVAAVAFVWFLNTWNLLGWRY
jgi:CubicO group peptidase (beta-lactamase class C family)